MYMHVHVYLHTSLGVEVLRMMWPVRDEDNRIIRIKPQSSLLFITLLPIAPPLPYSLSLSLTLPPSLHNT